MPAPPEKNGRDGNPRTPRERAAPGAPSEKPSAAGASAASINRPPARASAPTGTTSPATPPANRRRVPRAATPAGTEAAPLAPKALSLPPAVAGAIRIPLVRKAAFLVGAVAAAGAGGTAIANYLREVREVEALGAQRLLAVAATGALTIDADKLRRAPAPGSTDYEEIREQLRAVRDANVLGQDHINLIRADDRGALVYAVTPSEDRDAAAPGSPYPAGADAPREAIRRVLDGRQPAATPVWSNAGGRYLSAFAPVKTSGGELAGILEVDLRVEQLSDSLVRTTRHILVDSLVAALAAILIGAYFALRLVRPIRLLTDRMELIASGRADLTQEIDAGAADEEVRMLVAGFNRAVRSLRELVTAVHLIGQRASSNAASGADVARSLLEGSRGQVEALTESRASAEALRGATQQIAKSTDHLDNSAHEIAAAIVGMEQSLSAASDSLARMNRTINTTATHITQLTDAIHTINANVGNLGSTAEDVTARVSTLDSSLRDINRFTEETSAFSVTTREAAEAGREAVSATHAGMSAIEMHTRRVSETMLSLASVSEEIGEIVQVIRSVAERTNLLALNAAIIAARAGEQGQGFQVVAQEIRDLAERTRMSTTDIGGLITRVQRGAQEAVQIVAAQTEAVAHGRKLAGEAMNELARIAQAADETGGRIESIVKRAEEQTESSRRVLAGVERMQQMLAVITRATREQSQASGAVQRATDGMALESEQTTAAFTQQTLQIRGIVQTMEKMTERLSAIAAQTRSQQGDAERLGRGITEVLELADGFSEESHKLEAAMSAIAGDVATLTSEVERYKVI